MIIIVIICLLFAVVFLYKMLYDLKIKYTKINNENSQLKSKVDDLSSYKNDVSKTFEILNNDLKIIHKELNIDKEQNCIEYEKSEQVNEEVLHNNTPISSINPGELFLHYFGSNVNNPNMEQFTNELINTVSRNLVNITL
jgi:hypothetical protein